MALLQTGTEIDGFEIRRQIGEGGFGEVFEALELVTARRVALKVVKKDRRTGEYDPNLRARFEREARSVAKLKSPHIVRLYSAGELSNGLLYGAFEYIEGMDFSEYLENGVPPVDMVVDVLTQLLRALQEAHSMGLLHRDIKPQNIRVQRRDDGSVVAKLLDFGIVRAADDGHPALTATGELIGTPRYMSPEQLTDRPLSAASDIYSLGMVAVEALAGPDALPGGSWGAQLERLQSGHVFSAPTLERIGPKLVEIVQRMTARRPEDRYTSAAAVLHALVQGGGERSPARPLTEPSASPARARRVLPVIGLLALVALVVFAAVYEPKPPEPPVPTPGSRTFGQLLKNPHTDAGTEVRDTVDVRDSTVATDLESRCDLARGWQTLEFGSLNVAVYMPQSHTGGGRPAMIAIFRRGGNITPRQFVEHSGMIEVAEAHQVVLVAPNSHREGPYGLLPSWMSDVTDEAWRAVAELQQRCTDPDRLFLLGRGSGAVAVDRLWALHGEYIAAAATTGHRYKQDTVPPEPSPPRPYLHFAQPDSPREPKEGGKACNGEKVWSLEKQRAHQLSVHGCSDDGETTRHKDGHCTVFECEVPFVGCEVRGGLDWTRRAPPRGDVSCKEGRVSDFPYQDVVWAFFAAHARDP